MFYAGKYFNGGGEIREKREEEVLVKNIFYEISRIIVSATIIINSVIDYLAII